MSNPRARARWRKSSHSGPTGGNCVEVAAAASRRVIGVRDSQDPSGPALAFTARQWRAFLSDGK
jgi:hypothetical protein